MPSRGVVAPSTAAETESTVTDFTRFTGVVALEDKKAAAAVSTTGASMPPARSLVAGGGGGGGGTETEPEIDADAALCSSSAARVAMVVSDGIASS